MPAQPAWFHRLDEILSALSVQVMLFADGQRLVHGISAALCART